MRIAFDLRRIGNPGIGRYMKSLVESVAQAAPTDDYFLIVAPGTESLLPDAPGAERVFAGSPYYSVGEQIELPRLIERYGIDLLHAPHFVVPVRKKCRTVVTIHDTIHLIYPQDLPSFTGRVYARLMMMTAVRVADRIIALSGHAKSEIVRLLGAREAKIQVVPHPGVSPEFFVRHDKVTLAETRAKFGISGRYILYTGIFRERKNHIGLLRSFALLRQKQKDVQLVIAGPLDKGEAILKGMAAKFGIADQVVLTRFVSNEELPALYFGASVYACPSLYEGFGLTVLEAMACGVPVVAHTGTSLPEICGDAALLSDATQAEKFAAALEMALEPGMMRDSLIERGFQNVKRYSRDKCSTEVIRLYNELSGRTVQEVMR